MRVLFICGSLEPGRDGVGDYTRRLAGECIRQGHECAAIALNDKAAEAAFLVPRSKSFVERLRQSSWFVVLRSLLARKVDPEPESTKNQEQGTRNSIYTTKNQEQETRNNNYTTKNQEPGTKNFRDFQSADGTPLPVLRLPATLSWRKRMKLAENYVADFDPEWISLQYVPYAFHNKGLPFLLPGRIKRLLRVRGQKSEVRSLNQEPELRTRNKEPGTKNQEQRSTEGTQTQSSLVAANLAKPKRPGVPFNNQHSEFSRSRRLHIMFHELWVGPNPSKPFRSNLTSWLQKLAIAPLRFVDCAHTHLPLYQSMLEGLGFEVAPLPLFSNIPCKANPSKRSDPSVINIGFFSQMSPNETARSWLCDFIDTARADDKSVRLHLAGGVDFHVEYYWRSAVDTRAEIVVHGWMHPEEVSIYLTSLDIGLTTISQHTLGKSSSVAAFITHNLEFAAPNATEDVWGLFYEIRNTRPGCFWASETEIDLRRITVRFLIALETAKKTIEKTETRQRLGFCNK